MIKRLTLSFFSLLLCVGMYAQVANYIYVSGQAGEYSYLTDISLLKSNLSVGGAGAVGFGYELHANNFLFNLGLSAQISHTILNGKNALYRLDNVVDDEGDKLSYIFDQQKRTDGYTSVNLQVPLMVGAQAKKFYFLIGAKFDMSMVAFAKSTAWISSKGVYDKLVDPIDDMPEHAFFNQQAFTTRNRVQLNPNVLLSLEMGGRLHAVEKGTGFDVPKDKDYGRLAFYVDFGLFNLNRGGSKELLELPTSFNTTDMTTAIKVNDILSSSVAENAVRSLSIGIKYTYLFRIKDRVGCVICRDAYKAYQPNL